MGKKKKRSKKKTNVVYEGHEGMWDSGLVVDEKPLIKVPFSVVEACKRIRELVNGNEFSILVKTESEGVRTVLTEEYYIPKQRVERASVDYDEDLSLLRKKGYNAVIHGHPDGMSSFSGADYEYINSHFPASLLFEGGTIKDATVLLTTDTGSLVVNAKTEVVYPEVNVDEAEVKKKIKMQEIKTYGGGSEFFKKQDRHYYEDYDDYYKHYLEREGYEYDEYYDDYVPKKDKNIKEYISY